jgi:predicted transcriptional regulator
MDGDVLSLTANIVSAHVSNNEVSASQLPTLIRGVHQALATIGQTVAETLKAEAVVSAMKSVFSDRIVCLECSKGLKMLKRHIGADHGMTPHEYRAKWGLPSSYPMVAPEYAAQRSQLAKNHRFGRKVVAPTPPPRKRGRPAKVK